MLIYQKDAIVKLSVPVFEEYIYDYCLRNNKVYFGTHKLAHQCGPHKHRAFQAIIRDQFRNSDRPIKLLEIGSWAGGSAIAWAHALLTWAGVKDHSVLCVDPWRPYFDSSIDPNSKDFYCDNAEMDKALRDDSIFGLFQHNVNAAGLSGMITPFRAPATEALQKLDEEQFDLIFVDGMHDRKSVVEDVTMARRCLKTGGIMCGDDLDLQMHEVDAEFCKASSVRDFVTDPQTGQAYHPGVTHAVYELFGRVAVSNSIWAVRKTETGWQNIEISDPSDIMVPTQEWFGSQNWSPEEQLELAKDFDVNYGLDVGRFTQAMTEIFYSSMNEDELVAMVKRMRHDASGKFGL